MKIRSDLDLIWSDIICAQACFVTSSLAFQVPNTFSVVTKNRGFLLQTLGEKEIHEWLYAINPLLAGQIRSKLARKQNVHLCM